MEFETWLDGLSCHDVPRDSIKIHLPKVYQSTNYTCGAVALQSICMYYGVGPTTEQEYELLVKCDPAKGTPPINIVIAAKQLGLRVKIQEKMTIQGLCWKLDKKIPVICDMQAWGNPNLYTKGDSGHYVTAIGYDKSHIFFEDSSLHEDVRGFLTYREFHNRWHDKKDDGTRYERLGIALWSCQEYNQVKLLKARKI